MNPARKVGVRDYQFQENFNAVKRNVLPRSLPMGRGECAFRQKRGVIHFCW